MMVKSFNEEAVRAALDKAWSLETAKQWSKENPANGQCNVTAAVIQDLFGGEIWKTRLPGVWHYYNAFDGKRIDLTDTQFTRPEARFAAPQTYDDEVSMREVAMDGIPQREFDTLKAALVEQLER
jgi:hypothetical protein